MMHPVRPAVFDGDPANMPEFTGGKNVYGFPLGILMLESRFPRVPGDAGNASTWPFPVLYRVVDGAAPSTVVRGGGKGFSVEAFVAGARELERAGASVVSTNCGFLVLLQSVIQDSIGVPFISSSLLQVAWLQRFLPAGTTVGVLTIDGASLTESHRRAASIPDGTPIVGMEEVGMHFVDSILNDRETLDFRIAEAEHIAAARLLVERHPEVGAIVLECSNMPPYARAIQAATGRPVYDITTLLESFVGGYRRPARAGWM